MVNINDQVRSKKGIVGVVQKIYESSVMIKILVNPTEVIYENNVTVINHKNYEVIKKAAI